MTKAIETAIRLLETFPEPTQEHLVDELRRLALDAQDEDKWGKLLAGDRKLKAAGERLRQEIAAGHASDMDFERL